MQPGDRGWVCRAISHARLTSASDAFGDGTCDAYAGTAAHSDADGEVGRAARVVQHADDAGGALVAAALQVEPLDESWSVAVPMSCTGRLCGTSASSAPRVSTMRRLEALGDADAAAR